MPSTTVHVTQPSAFKRTYQLIDSADTPVGTLQYSRKTAQAHYEGQHWTLTEKGVLTTTVDILDTVSGKLWQGAYKKSPLHRSGTLTIDGHIYHFKHDGLGLLRSHYAWFSEDGTAIVRFTNGGFITAKGDITIEDITPADTAHLLVMLGLFLALNSDRDDTAVAAS